MHLNKISIGYNTFIQKVGGRKMDYKQVIEQESQETHINIDYSEKKIYIDTNKAAVMNRMTRLGYKPVKFEKINGEICGMVFELDTKDIGKFLRTGIFKYN